MMYWTFDEYRQDRQEILFGPYLTYPTSYYQDAGECFQATKRYSMHVCLIDTHIRIHP